MNRIPQAWPGWEVVELIGEGSFGRVYRVRHKEVGHVSEAAVKVIDIPRDEAEVSELRFMGYDALSIRSYFEDAADSVMREVALMEQLKGAPGVVHVEDFQMLEREDSVGWTVLIRMELLESLPSVIGREGTPSPEVAARIAADVCAGLEACHQEGVIHRDVKPANVFRSRFGDYKLGDFGLARRIQEGSRSAKSIAGTEDYMAPEVPSGRYDARVDTYSLGLMLYRWLNGGRPPFLGPVGAPSRADVERAKLRRMSGERPSLPAGIGIDPVLGTIALRAVEPDPADRWRSAAEMRDALERWLAREADVPVVLEEFEAVEVGSVEAAVTPRVAAVPVTAGCGHTVAIRSNGTAVAAGRNDDGRCDVSGWSGLVAISAGGSHTVGLRSDGTAVAAGYNGFGQCDVSDWSDLVAVSAGGSYTVGLRSDGTAVAVGGRAFGCREVTDWSGLVAVSAGYHHTVGLRSDGTAVAVGENSGGQCDVSGWSGLVAVSAGGSHTVGLRSDGTAVAVGENWHGSCDVSGWSGLVAVSAGHSYTVGLRPDGTAVAVGWNRDGRCDVSGWSGLVAVSAGYHHTVGLRSDGTMVGVGEDDYGECDVSGWSGLIPSQSSCLADPSVFIDHIPDYTDVEVAISDLKSSWACLVRSTNWASDALFESLSRDALDEVRLKASKLCNEDATHLSTFEKESFASAIRAAGLIVQLPYLSDKDVYQCAVEISNSLDTVPPNILSVAERSSGKIDISNARLEIIGDAGLPEPSDMRFTGKPLKPKVVVWMIDPYSRNETCLREGIDYTLFFSDNIEPSTLGGSAANVCVRGTGTYRGVKKAGFRILRDSESNSGTASFRIVSIATFARKACADYLRATTLADMFHESRGIRGGLCIPDGVKVYLIHDDSLLKNGKSGFAITDKGLYCRQPKRRAEALSWRSVAWMWDANSVVFDDPCISIGGRVVACISGVSEDQVATRDLLELYKKLVMHAVELRDAGCI